MARTARTLVVALCLVVLGGAAVRIAVHDPTSEPVSGDQASFVYQALSLQGGNLSYDGADQERWLELGWAEQPHGLFLQARDDGWAFAKPLGYSVLLAPAMAAFGAHGVTVVGAALLLAYAGCWYAIARRRWDRVTSVAVATTASVASHAWLYGFPAHADLFVAVLVGIAALAATRVAWPRVDDPAPRAVDPWLVVAAVACALLVTEKPPALLAVAPLVVLATLRRGWTSRLVAAGVGALVLAVSVAPYLYYSDGASWNAYGGDRYYALPNTPWSGGTEADLTPWRTRDSFSPGHVLDSVTDPSSDIPGAAITYAVGRHTGVLTFQPVVAALLAGAAVAGAVAWRRHRRETAAAPAPRRFWQQPRNSEGAPLLAVLAAAGLAGYAGLYVVAFTDNYFGGGQSIGSRYFLQISALVAVVAVASPLSARAARWCAAFAAAWALLFLHPQLLAPEEAFFRIDRTSAAQRVLPFETTQVHSWRFSCEPGTCVPPDLEALE